MVFRAKEGVLASDLSGKCLMQGSKGDPATDGKTINSVAGGEQFSKTTSSFRG